MKSPHFLLLFGILALIAAACNCDKNKVYHHNWVLDKYGAASAPTAVVPTNAKVSLKINNNQKFTGNDGCNSVFGSCIVSDQCKIKFDSMANTLIFCQGAGVMEQADAVKSLLKNVDEFRVTDAELKLCAPGDKVMIFHKE